MSGHNLPELIQYKENKLPCKINPYCWLPSAPMINSFLARGVFCQLLVIFTSSLDPDQAWSGSKLTHWWYFWNNFSKVEFTSNWLSVRMRTKKLNFLFLNQNICCGYSKNRLSETVLLSTQNMLKLMAKTIFIILRSKFFLNLNLNAYENYLLYRVTLYFFAGIMVVMR